MSEAAAKKTHTQGPHLHPCEICGEPVDCEDECDEEIQSMVYCPEHGYLDFRHGRNQPHETS